MIRPHRLLILVITMHLALSLKFSVTIPGYETRCFYEQLGRNTKYAVEVTPAQKSRYTFSITDIGNDDNYKPQSIFNQDYSEMQSVKLSKFAPITSYYGFCTRNLQGAPLEISFDLKSGLDLMELDILPDKTDNENLDKEVDFLVEQQQKLFESLQTVENARSNTQTLLNIMSTKTVYFGIAGFVVLLLVNVGFYREVRKTLKERKLI